MGFTPIGGPDSEPVEHHLRETIKLLRQVVDVWLGRKRRWTTRYGGAVACGVATRFKRKIDSGELGIEPVRRVCSQRCCDERKRVSRKVTWLIELDGDHARRRRRWRKNLHGMNLG